MSGGDTRARRAAFLLCGGAGTRLRAVTDRPKGLVEVAGWPFLRYHLAALRDARMDRVVFLTGYRGDLVERAFGPATATRIFIREETPLGTGGALAHARDRAAETNWIANGDSFVDLAPEAVLAGHRTGSGTIVAVRLEDAGDYGSLDVDAAGGAIRGFLEKGRAGPGLVNAGVYVLDRALLEELPEGPSSIERDAFPRWAREGRLRAHVADAFFRDIGTPERLVLAQAEFAPIRARFEAAR